MADVYGFWCSVLAWSALTSSLTVEFTTPYTFDGDGFALCATDNSDWNQDNFKLRSLERFEPGGNITRMHLNFTIMDSAQSNWTHNVLEFGTTDEILGNDPYYAESYEIQKFDDVQERVPGLVSRNKNTRSNCVLVTVPLRHQTTYRASFFLDPNSAFARPVTATPSTQPTPTGNGTSSGNGTTTTTTAVATTTVFTNAIWMAPLSYNRIDTRHVRYSTRGDKYGQVCDSTTRPGAYTRTSAQQEMESVCITLTRERADLLRWRISDNVVNRRTLSTFLTRFPKLVDEYYIRMSNATYRDLFRIDGRRRELITRRSGILPNCNKCEGGWFKDHLTGALRYPRDVRFDNLNVYRYIGYIMLDSWAQYRCDGIFNPDLAKTPFPLKAKVWSPWPSPVRRQEEDFRPA